MGFFLVSGQHGRLSAVVARCARLVWRDAAKAGTGVQPARHSSCQSIGIRHNSQAHEGPVLSRSCWCVGVLVSVRSRASGFGPYGRSEAEIRK